MSIRDVLAKNLRLARRAANLSQEALADLSGLDRTYIGSLERTKYAATIDVLEQIAGPLGVEPADLITKKKSSRS